MPTLTFTQQTDIPAASADLDVAGWLFSMSDSEYQRTATGHRALGVHVEDGRRGMVNVESIGGNLLVQHYREEHGDRSQVLMVSPRTTLYMMHLVPVTLGVEWGMRVTGKSRDVSTFTCTISLQVPRWLRIVGVFAGLRMFVQRHLDEETIGYASSLASRRATP